MDAVGFVTIGLFSRTGSIYCFDKLLWIVRASSAIHSAIYSANPNRHDQNNELSLTEVVLVKIKTNFVCANLFCLGSKKYSFDPWTMRLCFKT